jgi:hypothetical protein
MSNFLRPRLFRAAEFSAILDKPAAGFSATSERMRSRPRRVSISHGDHRCRVGKPHRHIPPRRRCYRSMRTLHPGLRQHRFPIFWTPPDTGRLHRRPRRHPMVRVELRPRSGRAERRCRNFRPAWAARWSAMAARVEPSNMGLVGAAGPIRVSVTPAAWRIESKSAGGRRPVGGHG